MIYLRSHKNRTDNIKKTKYRSNKLAQEKYTNDVVWQINSLKRL